MEYDLDQTSVEPQEVIKWENECMRLKTTEFLGMSGETVAVEVTLESFDGIYWGVVHKEVI